MSDGLYDVADVATIMKLKAQTIRRMLSRGELPAPIRINSKLVRWRAADIKSWIESGCPKRNVKKKAPPKAAAS